MAEAAEAAAGSCASSPAPATTPAPVLLALPGPAFAKINWRAPSRKQAEGVRFNVLGKDLYLEEEMDVESEQHEVKTAGSIWDCSLVLAKYVAKHTETLIKGKSVLELGSGQGVVGLSCSLAGAASVTLTDVGPALPLLEANIALNQVQGVSAAALDWMSPTAHLKAISPAEVIVAADTVWVEDLVIPFVNTLAAAATASRERFGAVLVLLCHKTRSRKTDEILFENLRRNLFSWTEVGVHHLDETYRNPDLQLWKLELLPAP